MTSQDREHGRNKKTLYFTTFNNTFSLFFFEQVTPHFHSAFGLTNYVAALTTDSNR